MCAIPQLVSAPLNPIPIAEHFRRSHPQSEHSYGQHIYMSEENKVIKYEKNEIEGYELKSKNVTGGVGVNKFKLIM